MFVLWTITINLLYYRQFWAEFEPKIRALLQLWHS
jgi:hypothetical protein